ncbi:MAG TPA: GNAT family N-acetyltransferase [candidate division Zixibacteria bacterium]|nr:GNAT family N-acetyltransferase [candidate division Zixibacteria bacterium]
MGTARMWVRIAVAGVGDRTGFFFAIADCRTDDLLGMIALHGVNWHDRNGEIFYWLARPFWRSGLTEDALRLLLGFAFRRLRLHRVWASVVETNRPSTALLEKAGFSREVVRRDARRRGRAWLDMYTYGLLGEEFAPQRRRV